MTGAACAAILWFFMSHGNTGPAVAVGPFGSREQCEWYRAKLYGYTYGCWEVKR
jgi:hypothetical protein